MDAIVEFFEEHDILAAILIAIVFSVALIFSIFT